MEVILGRFCTHTSHLNMHLLLIACIIFLASVFFSTLLAGGMGSMMLDRYGWESMFYCTGFLAGLWAVTVWFYLLRGKSCFLTCKMKNFQIVFLIIVSVCIFLWWISLLFVGTFLNTEIITWGASQLENRKKRKRIITEILSKAKNNKE